MTIDPRPAPAPAPGDQTFLFADLSGFSALTEEMGDEVAADVALGFCDEINRLLPECGEDLKMRGDSCLVRCEDPACAVALALELTGGAGRRHGVPGVRVGMHRGGAVFRRGDWFGGTINVAARIVALAAAGEVLVSEAVRDAVPPSSDVGFLDRGRPPLRNIAAPPRLYVAARAPDGAR